MYCLNSFPKVYVPNLNTFKNLLDNYQKEVRSKTMANVFCIVKRYLYSMLICTYACIDDCH